MVAILCCTGVMMFHLRRLPKHVYVKQLMQNRWMTLALKLLSIPLGFLAIYMPSLPQPNHLPVSRYHLIALLRSVLLKYRSSINTFHAMFELPVYHEDGVRRQLFLSKDYPFRNGEMSTGSGLVIFTAKYCTNKGRS